jgi:hypothetical protein
MNEPICAICNKPESEHHAFVPAKRPKGCFCKVTDWRDKHNIPPVCAEYKSATGGYCDNCEHDARCHAA